MFEDVTLWDCLFHAIVLALEAVFLKTLHYAVTDAWDAISKPEDPRGTISLPIPLPTGTILADCEFRV